jgi:hypothetical protein
MKKLFYLPCAFALIALFFLASCQKDVQTKNEHFNYTVITPYDDNLKFESLGTNYTVKDGYLEFQTLADLNKTIHFLRRANPVEIDKWENSLYGFTSIFRNYTQAVKELEENPTNLEQIIVRP